MGSKSAARPPRAGATEAPRPSLVAKLPHGSFRKAVTVALFVVVTGALAMPASEWGHLVRAIGSAVTPASNGGVSSQAGQEHPTPTPASRTASNPPRASRAAARNQATAIAGSANLPKGDEQPFGFAGYVKDPESGLYYAKARYYDPAVGRFTTEDPFAGNDMEPPSLHRYLYAYANPTAYADPTGRASLDSQRLAYQQSIDFAPSPEARRVAEGVMRDYEANRHAVAMEAAKAGVVSLGLVVGGAYVAEGVMIGRAMYATYAAFGASAAFTQHGPAAANYVATGVEAAIGVATGANAPSAVPEAVAASAVSAEARAGRSIDAITSLDVPTAPGALRVVEGDGFHVALEPTLPASVLRASVPDSIDPGSLGALLGRGGNKNVYAYGENQAVGVLHQGKSADLISKELTMLDELRALGLPTVNARGPVNVGGQTGLLFDRFAQGSKDVVKLQNGKVKRVGDSPYLNERSVEDLTRIRTTMTDDKIKIDDLQFLIGQDGRVVVSDPLKVHPGQAPSPNNLRMIDLLIKASQENATRH